jgi:FKBP-type peptidyl-prolyl cis-trans isomerase FklB
MSIRPALTSKTLLLASFLAGGILLSSGQTQNAQTAAKPTATKAASASAAPVLDTPKAKTSYAIGANLGNEFRSQAIDIDPAILYGALQDALAGRKSLMTEDEIHATLLELSKQIRERQTEQRKELGDKNQKEGEAFLAENKAKDGVVVLPSGLQYKILKSGEGKKPAASDIVVCNYRGALVDGKEFDSSEKHNGPATFPVSGVIKGWSEALQLMPVGSKWELFIPANLAYGERGMGPTIGPNATLIFDLELLSIKEPSPSAEKPADKQ